MRLGGTFANPLATARLPEDAAFEKDATFGMAASIAAARALTSRTWSAILFVAVVID